MFYHFEEANMNFYCYYLLYYSNSNPTYDKISNQPYIKIWYNWL